MDGRTPLYAVVGGALLTLLAGLARRHMSEGATPFGYPLPWLFRLELAPQYFSWRVNVLNLVVDVILWAAPIFAAMLLLRRRR